MTLFAFREQLETRPGFPCRAFRWSFQVSWLSIGLVHQFMMKDRDEWLDNHARVFMMTLTRAWHLGSMHIYYDGPHCSFSIGPLHLLWSGNLWTGRCAKCDRER